MPVADPRFIDGWCWGRGGGIIPMAGAPTYYFDILFSRKWTEKEGGCASKRAIDMWPVNSQHPDDGKIQKSNLLLVTWSLLCNYNVKLSMAVFFTTTLPDAMSSYVIIWEASFTGGLFRVTLVVDWCFLPHIFEMWGGGGWWDLRRPFSAQWMQIES